jgi:cysteine sulfinate desulfinase/cysteine desulfurase-like protein
MPRAAAESSIRIGLGRFTTEEEVDLAGDLIASAARELRTLRRRISA